MNNLLLKMVVQLLHMEYPPYLNQYKTCQEIHLLSLIKRKTNQIILLIFFFYIQVYFDHIFQIQVDVYVDQLEK